MGKKRSKPVATPEGQKRRKPRETEAPREGDRLGKLVKQYGVNLAEALVASGLLGLVGGGVLLYAMGQEPRLMLWLIIGAGIVLMGVALLGYNALNIGRRLEVRKRGIRFTEYGSVTEFAWSDIVDIQINRRDDTYLGIASVERRSSDAVRSSGPLTKTEWDVTILSHDDRTIRLRPTFLRIVPDPKKLISQLRLGAGIK